MSRALVAGHAAPRRRSVAVDSAIVLSATAALAHLVVAPAHYTWWPAAGVFFGAIGIAQLAFATLLLPGAPNRRIVLAGIWATVAVVLVYVASRTVGIPGAPPVAAHGGRWVIGRSFVPGGAKHVGPLDIFTLLSEVLLVVTLLGMLPTRSRTRAVNGLLVIGLGLWGAGTIGVFW